MREIIKSRQQIQGLVHRIGAIYLKTQIAVGRNSERGKHMGKFRVGISFPGEYVFCGVRARDPLEAIEIAEKTLLKIDSWFSSDPAVIALPAPRKLDLESPLEAFVEELSSRGKVIREFGLEPHPWKVIS